MHDSCMHHFHDSFMHLILVRCAPEKRTTGKRAPLTAHYDYVDVDPQSSILTQKKVDIGHHRQHITYIRAESGQIKSNQIKTKQNK